MARRQWLSCRRSLGRHRRAHGRRRREKRGGEVHELGWLVGGVMGVLLGGSSSPIGGWEWRE
jgi:hypothetical protein